MKIELKNKSNDEYTVRLYGSHGKDVTLRIGTTGPHDEEVVEYRIVKNNATEWTDRPEWSMPWLFYIHETEDIEFGDLSDILMSKVPTMKVGNMINTRYLK